MQEKIPVIWEDVVASTNTTLAKMVSGGEVVHKTVLAALSQTAGRGRYARTWTASAGTNLTFSLYWHTDCKFPRLASVPMAVALGVSEYLHAQGVASKPKWPNDVMVGQRKICGILSERSQPESGGNDLIIGVGLNINMTPRQASEIDKPATSYFMETGKKMELHHCLDELLVHLLKWLDIWQSTGFIGLREFWMHHAWNMGQQVLVGEGENRKRGVLKGFGEHGQLVLELNTGQSEEVWSGDIDAYEVEKLETDI